MQSAIQWNVLAAESRISDMSQYFRDSNRQSMDGATLAWIVLGIAFAIGLAVAIGYWHSRPVKPYRSHDKLFASLCLLHGLDRRDRELLKAWATSAHIEMPARWFTEPALLRSFKQQAEDSSHADIERLQDVMFRSTSH